MNKRMLRKRITAIVTSLIFSAVIAGSAVPTLEVDAYNNTFSTSVVKDNVLTTETPVSVDLKYDTYDTVQKVVLVFDADFTDAETDSQAVDNLAILLSDETKLTFTLIGKSGISGMTIAEVAIPDGTDISGFDHITISRETNNAKSIKLTEVNLVFPNRYAYDNNKQDSTSPNSNVYIEEKLTKDNQICVDISKSKGRGTLQSIRVNLEVDYDAETIAQITDFNEDIWLGYYVNGEYNIKALDLNKQYGIVSINVDMSDVSENFTFTDLVVGYSGGNAKSIIVKSVDVVFDPSTLRDISNVDENGEFDYSNYPNAAHIQMNSSFAKGDKKEIDISQYAESGGISKVVLDYSLSYIGTTEDYAQDGGELVIVTTGGWKQFSYEIAGTLGETTDTVVEIPLDGYIESIDFTKPFALTHSWGTATTSILNTITFVFKDGTYIVTTPTTATEEYTDETTTNEWGTDEDSITDEWTTDENSTTDEWTNDTTSQEW